MRLKRMVLSVGVFGLLSAVSPAAALAIEPNPCEEGELCLNEPQFMSELAALPDGEAAAKLALEEVKGARASLRNFILSVTNLPASSDAWDPEWLNQLKKCEIVPEGWPASFEILRCLNGLQGYLQAGDNASDFNPKSEGVATYEYLRKSLMHFHYRMIRASVADGAARHNGVVSQQLIKEWDTTTESAMREINSVRMAYGHTKIVDRSELPDEIPSASKEYEKNKHYRHPHPNALKSKTPVQKPKVTQAPDNSANPAPPTEPTGKPTDAPKEGPKVVATPPVAPKKPACAKDQAQADELGIKICEKKEPNAVKCSDDPEEAKAKGISVCSKVKPKCTWDMERAEKEKMPICRSTRKCARDPKDVTDTMPMCTTDESGTDPGAEIFGSSSAEGKEGVMEVDCTDPALSQLASIAWQPRYGTDKKDMCPVKTQAHARLFYCSNRKAHPGSSRAEFAGLLAMRISEIGIELDNLQTANIVSQIADCEVGNTPQIKHLHQMVDDALNDIETLQQFDTSAELESLKISIKGIFDLKSCDDLQRKGENGLRRMYRRSFQNWLLKMGEKDIKGISKDTTQGGGLPPALLNPCADDDRFQPTEL